MLNNHPEKSMVGQSIPNNPPGTVNPKAIDAPQTVNPAGKNRLWVVWLMYFFQFAAIGVYFTFLNVYYKEAGLSGTQIGLLNMATASISVGAAFVWGYLADRTGQTRYLIAFGAFSAIVTSQFVPYMHTFVQYLLVACLGTLLSSSIGTLLDSTTLAMLGMRREDYGRYRLGGTFGYILAAASSGFVFDLVGLRWMFPAYGMIMVGFGLTALLLPKQAVRLKGSGGGEIGRMMREPAWMIFTGTIFLVWIASNASIMFMGVVLRSMGANQGLIGMATVVGAIIEIPFMAFYGTLNRRFGAVRLMWFAIFLQIIRYFLLSRMVSPEWAIAINLLNGPGFVLLWNSSVNYASHLAPAGLSSTAQGLLNSTAGLAGVVSSLLSGVLFDQLGPKGLFLVMTFCCLGAFILFGFGTVLRPAPAGLQRPSIQPQPRQQP